MPSLVWVGFIQCQLIVVQRERHHCRICASIQLFAVLACYRAQQRQPKLQQD